MVSLLVSIAFLACAPKAPGSTSAVTAASTQPLGQDWLSLDLDLPRLCLSSVPAAPRLPKADRLAVAQARQQLASGEPDVDLSALPDHPAVSVLSGAQAVLRGQDAIARETFRDLANSLPDDACLQQAAAFTSLRAGRADFAAPYLKAALELAPEVADIGLLDVALTVAGGGSEEDTLLRLRAVVSAQPDSPVANAWLGRALSQRGDFDLALPYLLAARAAGVPVDAALIASSRLAGDLSTYLSVVGVSPPLPVDVRAASDPVGAYLHSLDLDGLADSSEDGTDMHLWTVMQTSMGTLRCELFWRIAPVTVGNFIGLATGRTPWIDALGVLHTDPLYPGTSFHRVIPNFMIQAGDPLGDGSGGPGYAFLDETHPDLRFDRPGRLAMANSGPGTNGSQWFITETSVAHLDGKHTIFGQCDDASVTVVRSIARVHTGAIDKPLQPIVLQSMSFKLLPEVAE